MDQSFIEHFNKTTQVTCKAVAMVPPDKADLKPSPEMMSAKDLAIHIFVGEKGMMSGAMTGEITHEVFASTAAQAAGMTMEQIAAWGEKIHAETTEWLAKATPEDLTKPVKTFFGMPMTGQTCVMGSHEHMVHHRGQLYVYMRMMGLTPPNQYAP
jgi:uncharacterized damage-inducible protein DinB